VSAGTAADEKELAQSRAGTVMSETKAVGYRDKMRDECVQMYAAILKRRRISLDELADEFGRSPRTIRRWVGSFGLIMPVRIQAGVVLVVGC